MNVLQKLCQPCMAITILRQYTVHSSHVYCVWYGDNRPAAVYSSCQPCILCVVRMAITVPAVQFTPAMYTVCGMAIIVPQQYSSLQPCILCVVRMAITTPRQYSSLQPCILCVVRMAITVPAVQFTPAMYTVCGMAITVPAVQFTPAMYTVCGTYGHNRPGSTVYSSHVYCVWYVWP